MCRKRREWRKEGNEQQQMETKGNKERDIENRDPKNEGSSPNSFHSYRYIRVRSFSQLRGCFHFVNVPGVHEIKLALENRVRMKGVCVYIHYRLVS